MLSCSYRLIFKGIKMNNTDSNIEQSILLKAIKKDNKLYLDCTDAFKIAEQFNEKIIKIGKICNQKKIKLQKCQLGCF